MIGGFHTSFFHTGRVTHRAGWQWSKCGNSAMIEAYEIGAPGRYHV
jgi:hypothetical protein